MSQMPNDISYNQIIFLTKPSFNCQSIKKSFTENRKLILILEDSNKITIDGMNIETSGNKNRIRELLSMAEEKVLIFLKS